MRITAIETRRYRYPLDPPFSAAWDPEPRTHQDATIVVVRSSDGVEGYASGDGLPDRELLERLLVGLDPMRTDIVHGILETVDFHHGRSWTLEVAIWDLVGRAQDKPLWQVLGGRQDRILAYASSGELVSADERVRRSRGTARPGRTRGQAPSPLDGLARRPARDRGRAGRSRLGPGADGRRQPGVAHAG